MGGGAQVGKGPQAGIQIQDAQSAMALDVGMLPTRLSAEAESN